jgi:hypothetical protein
LDADRERLFLTSAVLIAALGDIAIKSGIESIIGNFDSAMLRLYQRLGVDVLDAIVVLACLASNQILAGTVHAGDRATLGAFLGWLAAAEQRENALDAGVGQPQEDCVQVLTVHAAKGLEWDVVAVTGLVEGTFPSGHNGTSPASSPGWLGGHSALPFPLRGDAESLPHWRFEAAGSLETLATELAESFYLIKPLPTREALQAWSNALDVAENDSQREAVYLHMARVEMKSGMFIEAGKNLDAVTSGVHNAVKELLSRNLQNKMSQSTGTH